MPARPPRNPWLPHAPSPSAVGRVFLVPYSGCGASMYRQWPRQRAGVDFLPVELPGHETRFAEPNFETWGEINTCTGTAAPLSSNSSCQAYPMCASGEETILCTVQDGSHCGSYRSFMIPQVAWEVLQRHALP